MIKNWTVVAETTKSVIAREIYLKNTEHSNHINTERIISLFGDETHSLNMLRNCESYKLKGALKKKGGRPPTAAIEFMFSVPKGIRPTELQWKRMFSYMMRDLSQCLSVPPKQLAPIVRAVLHQQTQDLTKKGSGDHIHVVIGKFTENGMYLRDLQRKVALRVLKESFNVSMLNIVGVNHATYEAIKPYKGLAKKRAPQWVVHAARTKEQSEIKEKHFKKTLTKILQQANKWLEAFELNDVRQLNRQYKRMSRELEQLEQVESSIRTEEEEGLLSLLSKLTNNIDRKNKKKNNLLSKRVASLTIKK